MHGGPTHRLGLSWRHQDAAHKSPQCLEESTGPSVGQLPGALSLQLWGDRGGSREADGQGGWGSSLTPLFLEASLTPSSCTYRQPLCSVLTASGTALLAFLVRPPQCAVLEVPWVAGHWPAWSGGSGLRGGQAQNRSLHVPRPQEPQPTAASRN